MDSNLQKELGEILREQASIAAESAVLREAAKILARRKDMKANVLVRRDPSVWAVVSADFSFDKVTE